MVHSTKVGRIRMCLLEPKGLELASQWIFGRRSLWDKRLGKLGSILGEED